MALTPVRWFLLLLVLCAMIAVAYLPPADIIESARWSPYAWPVNRATSRTRLAFAAERWAALSELEALRRSPSPSDAPAVIPRGGLSPEMRQAVDSLVRTIWRRAPRTDSSLRLRVVAAPAAGPTDLWSAAARPQVLLPELTDGHTCLVVLPAVLQLRDETGGALGWWRTQLRTTVGQAIAPCVLRAVLGKPGPEIGRWMTARRYDLAASIDWAAGGTDWDAWSEPWTANEAAIPVLMMRIVGVLPAPYLYSVGAAGCAGGRTARCREFVLAAPAALHAGPISIASGYGSRSRRDGDFISNLIQEQGLESFRRFWTSGLPVDGAFAQAYGVPLGAWTRGWVVRKDGEVELGAPLHPLGVLAGLLASLLVLGATAAAAASREIG